MTRLISIHPMLKLIQRISRIPYNTLYQIPQYLSTFLKFYQHRAICQKNLQNHRNTTVFADSRNFTLIGGW